MFEGGSTRSVLAARILRLTLLIGVLTIVAAAAVALVSTAQLSLRHSTGRDLIVVQLIEDRVQGRLRVVGMTSEQMTERIASLETSSLPDAMQASLSPRSPLFTRSYIADRSGSVVVSSAAGPADVFEDRIFKSALRGNTGFLANVTDSEEWELWHVSPAVTSDGERVLLLGQVDTQFLYSALTEAAAEAPYRRVMVVSAGRVLVHDGENDAPDLTTARWRAESESSGRISVTDEGGRMLTGLYADLQEDEGLDWRLVILEPADLTLRDTLRAVAPSLLVLLAGGLVALVMAWSVSARLVRPLRELERAAKSAAAGSYVRPLSVDRDDEIGRVADAFNQVSLRLNALHDLTQLLASANRLDDVLDGILSAVGHLVGPGAGAIYLLDESGSALVPAKVRADVRCSPLPVAAEGGGWLARVLVSADPIPLPGGEDRLAEELPGLAGGYGQALAAPLVAGDVPLGVVVALRDSESPLTGAEYEMLRTFSAQAAVAVQTSRLFEQESSLRRVAETLRAVAEQLVRPEGLDIAIARVERIVADFFDAGSVRVLVADPAVLAVSERDADRDGRLFELAATALGPGGVNGVVLLSADDLREADVEMGEEVLAVSVALDSDHGAVLLISGGERVADQRNWEVASAVADELALAFDNAYFFQRALTRAANLETIFRISQAVGSSLQVNVVLNRVLDVVQRILPADAVALLDYDSRRRMLTTAMARGNVPAAILHLEFAPGQDVPGQVFATGRSATIKELHPEMAGISGAAAETGMSSLLAVPLMARGRPIGILMVFSEDESSFSEEDVGMLQTFAIQAALAIDTARLYSSEHEVASVLQASILPEELPDFPEIDAGSVYAPAGGDAEIGGDYYDLFRAPDGAIWFSIADVCGKGVVAATKTSMIKYAIRSFVAAGLSPSRVLEEVNRMVAETGVPSDIVTVWAGRIEGLDADEPVLTWANGGHPPGLLRRPSGEMESLSVTGPLLGAIKEVPYEELRVPVNAGDSILLYTDGVTEARHGNDFFGENRVREAFDVRGSAMNTAKSVLDAVRRFVKSELRDDVAVLALTIAPRRDRDAS